jgi:N6-adenosine-specific RNA methylase IME4
MRASCEQTTIVLADPPWPHANGSRTNSGKSPKYPLMNLRDISALGPTVTELAGAHAVLYLWATGPHLPGAISTIEDWGFRYRSFHVWQKKGVACGFWVRSNAELLLIAERGRPYPPAGSELAATVFTGAALSRQHSAKPDFIHRQIERQWPTARRIELFARSDRAGWETFGADLGTTITSDGIHARS